MPCIYDRLAEFKQLQMLRPRFQAAWDTASEIAAAAEPQAAVCAIADGLPDMFGGEPLGFGGDIVEIDIGLLR